MFRIALKSILARKRRLFTTGIAVTLGVAFISGTFVLSDTLENAANDLVADIFKGNDAVIRSNDAQEDPFAPVVIRPEIPAELEELARDVPGVRAAAGTLQAYPTLIDDEGDRVGGGFGPPTLAFNWVDDDALRAGGLSEGRPPDGPDEAVLDFKTAEEQGWEIGDTFSAQFSSGVGEFEIVGIAGLGDDNDSTTGSKIILLTIDRLRELLDLGAVYDYIGVSAEDGVGQEELAERISEVMPADIETITGDAFLEENQEQIQEIIGIITQLVGVFGYIAMFVAAFIIYNTFSIVIAQRTRELALMRAVGAARRQLLSSVMLEALAIGIVASLLGLVVGLALATGLTGLLGNFLTIPSGRPELTSDAITTSLLIGTIVTVLAAVIPAVRSTRIPPIAALGEVAVDRSGTSTSRKVFGTLAIVGGIGLLALGLGTDVDNAVQWVGVGAALVFISILIIGPVFAGPVARLLGAPLPSMLGVSGNLARENASRNPKRTASTAAALTVGVSLVVIITVLAASISDSISGAFEDDVKADLVVDSGGFAGVGFDPALAEALEQSDDVESISPIRGFFGRVLNSEKAREEQEKGRDEDSLDTGPIGEFVQLVGVHPTDFFELTDNGAIEPEIEEIGDDEVVMTEERMNDSGWEIGDEVEFYFPGTGEISFTIAATTERLFFGDDGPIVNLDTYAKVAPSIYQVDFLVFIGLADGVDIDGATSRIEEQIEVFAPAASISSPSEFAADQTKELDGIINIIYGLLGLAIIIAVIGVGNTLSLSVYERTRELGLLRAVGMTRQQVRSMVRWESAVIALFGTVLGIVMGIALSYALTASFDEETLSTSIPVVQLLVIGVLGAAAGVLAAIRPARRASRLDVLESIATE